MEDLGGDADGDLFGGVAVDGEASGGDDGAEEVGGETVVEEVFADLGDLGGAAHDGEEREGATEQAPEGEGVGRAVHGHHDDVGKRGPRDEIADIAEARDGDDAVGPRVVAEAREIGSGVEDGGVVAKELHGSG